MIPENKRLFNQLISDEKIVDYLVRLRRHHLETYRHSIRVGMLSIRLGHEAKMFDDLKPLGYAGLLHDIGKLRIPAGVLSKNTGLNEDEMRIIQLHPRYSLLELHNFEYPLVKKIVIAHHEFKIDPYPRSSNERRRETRVDERRKTDINSLAQIIAVADIYDALVNARPYKPPLSISETEEIMRAQFKGKKEYVDLIFK